MKLASCFFAMFAFVCNANTYNDWAKGNAVNLNGQATSSDAATMNNRASPVNTVSGQCIARPAAYDLLNGINDANCNNANLRDAIINAEVPPTLKEMEDFGLGEFKELPLSESLYHNLREDITVLPSVKDLMNEFNEWVQRDALGTLLNAPGAFQREEYYVYLDHEMPNRKFVSNDNHREAVYNRKTGELVKTGINAGTSNEASRNVSLRHLKDMARYYRCLTPSAEQKALGEELSRHPELVEWLAKNPDLIDDILNGDISDPKRVVRSLEKKMSRIQQKTKDTLLGNDAKDGIGSDQLRDKSKSIIDMAKSETKSRKSKSSDVSDNSDSDFCKCANPDDRDFHCTKCGKMSKWLAPHKDKEFEQWLKKKK